MAVEDLDPVATLEAGLFSSPWSRLSFENELCQPSAHCFVVKSALPYSQVLGYIIFRIFETDMHLLKIAVDPPYQRKGLASWMLMQSQHYGAARGACSVYLEVRPSNTPAVTFYRKNGYRIIGNRPNYYSQEHEDALVMMNQIKEDNNEHQTGNKRFR